MHLEVSASADAAAKLITPTGIPYVECNRNYRQLSINGLDPTSSAELFDDSLSRKHSSSISVGDKMMYTKHG